ncbi:ribonuclease H-like domain-containing protein [Ilyonectria destructans]|nr:ribonuclease H-like domain-containing protein [Ilyonectria destructans]
MTENQPEKQRQCEHCLKTGHQADHCCQECVKWFGSKKSLVQHRDAKHGKHRAAMPSTNLLSVPNTDTGTQSSPALGSYTFSDEGYDPLTPPDMNVIYDLLLATCHSQERLRRESYFLRDDPNNVFRSKAKQASILKQCLPTPPSHPWFPKRKAVALDCEMAGVKGGGSEIVSICVVDFFTKEILVNSLVKPGEFIIQWRSDIHGVTPATMSIAVARQQALDGWKAAREELWKHANEHTVLVGQSLHNDLKALRVVHTKIVDTAIVSAEAAFGRGERAGRKWGLEVLCKELLNLRIRLGSGVHNDMEDTMAAREVALWCLCHPVELQQWGERARTSFYAERERNIQRQRSLAQKAPLMPGNNDSEEEGYIQQYYHSDDEILRWEDVVPWEIWPKSPPDSD